MYNTTQTLMSPFIMFLWIYYPFVPTIDHNFVLGECGVKYIWYPSILNYHTFIYLSKSLLKFLNIVVLVPESKCLANDFSFHLSPTASAFFFFVYGRGLLESIWNPQQYFASSFEHLCWLGTGNRNSTILHITDCTTKLSRELYLQFAVVTGTLYKSSWRERME